MIKSHSVSNEMDRATSTQLVYTFYFASSSSGSSSSSSSSGVNFFKQTKY